MMEWRLCYTSAWTYLQHYAHIDDCSQPHLFLARYFIEECFFNYKISQFSQHMIACSALYLANRYARKDMPWSACLATATKLKELDLRICTKIICIHLKKTKKSTKLTSVKRKFSAEEFYSVAQLPELRNS